MAEFRDGGRAAPREYGSISTDAASEAAPHSAGKGTAMTIETPAIVIPSPRRGSGRRLFIGLAAAALALTVGAGLWLADHDGGAESATPPAVAVAQLAIARPVAAAPLYYLVGSQADADAMRANIAQLGVAPLPEVVTVVTVAEADAFLRMMGEQAAVSDSLGLPSVTVVDLRAQPVATTHVDTRGGMAELYGQQQADRVAEEAAR
jgi:hypothetical protein